MSMISRVCLFTNSYIYIYIAFQNDSTLGFFSSHFSCSPSSD
uniref:Uncharacterized protein n=1 Tax=Heterorhabditis bacteriophora TaxID=37862 RepID=A0A1I7WXS5_HETBA